MGAQYFLQNPGYRGQPFTVCGAPFLNPNRGRLCPILGIAPPTHRPEAINFTLNLSNPQPRLDNENGAILETHGLPVVILKIR